jgi:hypothetical protein
MVSTAMSLRRLVWRKLHIRWVTLILELTVRLSFSNCLGSLMRAASRDPAKSQSGGGELWIGGRAGKF